MALADIKNYLAVNDWLATAGQPKQEELAAIAAGGFELVVNLGLLDPRYCLPDEAGSVSALGLDYRHIPVDFKAPAANDFRRFERTLLDAAGRRVFAHCAANYRVSCFVALFGEAHWGWSRERADAHVQRLWQPDEVWRAFIGAVRAGGA
ncbi:MAG TPA: protein tyrosine phosphatase family protein [Polyangiaceae bacterium]|nr:protein tyrosine phosphatase family protein [Polyangiaceae bacterium]